jgi:imidazole glycerol phosphate synthase subunit HisF
MAKPSIPLERRYARPLKGRVRYPASGTASSGGAGGPEHLADAIEYGAADAVLAAGIFHFGVCSIAETKAMLAARGIPVRPV